MIVLPAIDIKDGTCVRLQRGDYATAHKVADNPYETAQLFAQAGAEWIHMVDLDGAKDGRPVNWNIFIRVAAHSGLKVELGGGIRDMHTIEQYVEAGISRLILGSAALKNPTLVQDAVRAFGERIAVGIDARNGLVATEGWLAESRVSYLDLAKAMEEIGVKTIIYTDISRDGMLSGINTEHLAALSEQTGCQIIASGGVASLTDVRQCKALGLYGCICGKAIYSGALDLKKAIQEARSDVSEANHSLS